MQCVYNMCCIAYGMRACVCVCKLSSRILLTILKRDLFRIRFSTNHTHRHPFARWLPTLPHPIESTIKYWCYTSLYTRNHCITITLFIRQMISNRHLSLSSIVRNRNALWDWMLVCVRVFVCRFIRVVKMVNKTEIETNAESVTNSSKKTIQQQ